ncbi:hypothetical protein E8P82_01885 [Arthrobacter echini]|uniref:Uncharacterized protein n=1 Tax=Arthrobacter echini TaxID=1529066 RepID=A0A4S5EAC1_9MICC|nr:hypothetical protein [Arthrobacter echini]THJ68676.1 hypothetical protein E8P82_01885 [Arthrobacter echini]
MSRHRAGGTTRLPRRLRFLAKLLVAVVVLTLVPTVAQAAFSNREAGSTVLGTYNIPTPTGVDASYTCSTSSRRSATVTVRDFTAVARATGYTVTLTAPDRKVQTVELAASKRATTLSVASTTSGKYVLSVRANVGSWTGKDPAVFSFTC